MGSNVQCKKQFKTQKPNLESYTTTISTQKTTSHTSDKEKTRKKSNPISVRTRSLSQNLQQIFQPFQRGTSSLRSSTQSIATMDKDASSNKSSFSFSKNSHSDARKSDKVQIEHNSISISVPLYRSATQNIRLNKLHRFYRSKSISAPYVPKSLHSQSSMEFNKQLLTKAIAENRFLVETIHNHQHHDFGRNNDMTFKPIYQTNEVNPKHKLRHSKLLMSTNLKPFYSRQNSTEDQQSTSKYQVYSQSVDNLLSNELPTTSNKNRKKYSKTKSSTLIGKPSNLSLPFGGSCGSLNASQKQFQCDQSAYRTIHGTSIAPTQQQRPNIFKFVRAVKEVTQPTPNDYSNSDTFDEYDRTSDGSITDSSSSDMSFDMNLPTAPLKQSSSLSSVPNVQRKLFRSHRAHHFARMQSLDFTQSQTNVPMINPKIKNTSRTVPHSRTGSPVSSPLQSRAVTPTYFEFDTRHQQQQQQQHFKSLNQQQQYNNSTIGGVHSMASYSCHQTSKLTMPIMNLPKKSSSMSTMVAASPKSLTSGTSLSNIVWQNSPLVRHCFNFYYCFVHLDWNTLLMHRIFRLLLLTVISKLYFFFRLF